MNNHHDLTNIYVVCPADEAMKSLSGGEDSFLYLGQMLQVLLQTLLQDGIAQVSTSTRLLDKLFDII